MSITVTCPHCEADYQVPDSLLGKTIRCKSCQGAIPVRDPDEPEERRPARKAKRKSDVIEFDWVKYAILLTVVLAGLAFACWRIWATRPGANAPVVQAPPFQEAPRIPRPMLSDNGTMHFMGIKDSEKTDPDELINDKYPQADKFRFEISSPRIDGDRIVFDYSLKSPAEETDPRFPQVKNGKLRWDRVGAVAAVNGQIADCMVMQSDWADRGELRLHLFGHRIPPTKGMRICLTVDDKRVSNVIVIP